MKRSRWKMYRIKVVGMVCGIGTLFQFGGCELGQISLTQTIDGREALISLFRGAIITPLDAFLTESLRNALGGDR